MQEPKFVIVPLPRYSLFLDNPEDPMKSDKLAVSVLDATKVSFTAFMNSTNVTQIKTAFFMTDVMNVTKRFINNYSKTEGAFSSTIKASKNINGNTVIHEFTIGRSESGLTYLKIGDGTNTSKPFPFKQYRNSQHLLTGEEVNKENYSIGAMVSYITNLESSLSMVSDFISYKAHIIGKGMNKGGRQDISSGQSNKSKETKESKETDYFSDDIPF